MKKRKYLVSLGPFRRGCIVAWWDSVGAEMHAASVVSGLSLVDEPTVVNSTMVEFQLAIGLRQKFLNPVEIQPTHPCSAAAPEGSAAMQVVEDDNLIQRERLPHLVCATSTSQDSSIAFIGLVALIRQLIECRCRADLHRVYLYVRAEDVAAWLVQFAECL